jgi:glycosyltransferase involved in cell wall biosynthesis
MKILFLDQFSELGGGQQALLDTLDEVRQRGWGAHVLVPGDGPLLEELKSRNVRSDEIVCAAYGSGSKSAGDSARFLLDLPRQTHAIRDAMADGNIDLVYVNGPRLLPAAAMAARHRAPILFHLHTSLDGIALRLARWALRRTDATVVGCSHAVLEPFRQQVAHGQLHMIPNGVRDLGYQERDFDASGLLRIGVVGRVAPEKGQMEFVGAATLLAREFPQVRFAICGAPLAQARDGYYDAVRSRARELPIEFIPWQRDVSALIHDLDLLVTPSHREAMGRVVLEAFSAGVLVVAFPAGGIPEAVVDEDTGFLTREFTAEALAARIRDVMAMSPAKRRDVVRNARKAWARSYTRDGYQERITDLLATLAPVSPEEHAGETPLQHR